MYIPFMRFLESEREEGRRYWDRIVNIIKLLVHLEIGILDNPRVRRFRYTIEHIGAYYIIRRHCPCELVCRALLEVKPRKWFDNEVHYALPLPLASPPPSVILEGRSTSLLTPLVHVSATWSFFVCIQGFALGISNRYPNGQQDFAFASSQGVGLRSALRFPVFEFEIGERGVERRTRWREPVRNRSGRNRRKKKKWQETSDNQWRGDLRYCPSCHMSDTPGYQRIPVRSSMRIHILVKKTYQQPCNTQLRHPVYYVYQFKC